MIHFAEMRRVAASVVGSACVAPDDVVSFVCGMLDAPSAARIREHVDLCDDCRALLVAAGDEVATRDGGPTRRGPLDLKGTFNGRFRLEREIGSGTMGVVFAALDTALNRRVAIKILRAEASADEDRVARFVRETRVAANLVSPNVVRVLDVGHAAGGGPPYMVMELLEGQDLGKVADSGSVSIADAVSFISQACHALAEAHRAKIVHRDIKLPNLFLADGPLGPTVKVLDFGLAKATMRAAREDTVLTDAGMMMGTPLYMSPEQIVSARDVDPRTDVWAVGVCLYRLVAGRFPFEARSTDELCAKIMGVDPAPPSHFRPGVPAALDAVALRCLSRVAADRYPDAGALAAALTEAMAPPPPLPPKAVRRTIGRGWIIAAAVALVSIAIGVLIGARVASRASAPPVANGSAPVASSVAAEPSSAVAEPSSGDTRSDPQPVTSAREAPRRRWVPPARPSATARPTASGSLFGTER
jgi:eukaryotic-like serine/threonine-protein kinase